MSEPSKPPTRGRFRRLLQFRISTVLLLTMVAAVGMFFYTLPEVVEEDDETGQFRSVYQIYRDKDGKPVRHGVAKLYDEDGRIQYHQHFRSGKDAGKWTCYGPDGAYWEGEIRDGARHGTWIESYPNGDKRSETRYVQGKLEGKAQAWWPGEQPRYTGQYAQGRRSGRWTFWSKQGKKTAEGTYREGAKSGRWQEWDNKSVRLAAQHYLRGRLVRNADAVVKQWRGQLFGDNLAGRGEAAWALGELAELGAPVLEEAIESQDLDLRRRAFEQLARNDDWCKTNVGRLIAALDEPSRNVQIAAVTGLARVGAAGKKAFAAAGETGPRERRHGASPGHCGVGQHRSRAGRVYRDADPRVCDGSDGD